MQSGHTRFEAPSTGLSNSSGTIEEVMKHLLIAFAPFAGQAITLQDKPVVHLKPHTRHPASLRRTAAGVEPCAADRLSSRSAAEARCQRQPVDD